MNVSSLGGNSEDKCEALEINDVSPNLLMAQRDRMVWKNAIQKHWVLNVKNFHSENTFIIVFLLSFPFFRRAHNGYNLTTDFQLV